ncbi:LuxR C-terminal-related transcriptional regulator [Nocardia sp. CA-107356]|uniref:LuxR C-terminal-related transcriptional regulator n=1 Tax=Nocardia sp. CA-107356 TaxID=3239972 RepID=UPI003D8DFEE1
MATLAAEGLTHRQIAEKLYLSHRTVGSHLYRIFPRLASPAESSWPRCSRVSPPSADLSTAEQPNGLGSEQLSW